MMNTYPSLEARVSALEQQQTILNARIEEVAANMTASVKHPSEDMAASIKQSEGYQEGLIDTRYYRIDARLHQIDARLNKIESDIVDIRAAMAAKEDLTAMEKRLLDTFKQMLATINTQRPPAE